MSPEELPSRTDEDGELELSLGLSLNGKFGVDPVQHRKITKSASIANFVLSEFNMEQGSSVDLLRTCSLPVNEEERKRKKDMQTLRRMEAKRKRSEKQNNSRTCKLGEEDVNGVLVNPSSQNSIGSQGSGSSGLSETDSLFNDESRKKPPAVNHGEAFHRRGESTATRSVLEAMPHVSTRGLGPNGRRIEGFLYRYLKGEEVRILCVCHGSFHTPSEFVRHAGGGDVTHPLRHIVVDPNPLL